MTGQWTANGLHKGTPWWGVLIYRVVVVATLGVTAYHQFSAHSGCATLPLPPVG